MTPKMCCNSGIFFVVGACGAACGHKARRKSKSGLQRVWTWGFVCKVVVLCGQIRRRPLTSGFLQTVMVRCREHVFMDFSYSRDHYRSPPPLSHAGFVSFDKHDLLSANIHSALQHSFCFTLIYLPQGGNTLQ